MIYWLRCKIGGFLYWLGFRILPSGPRKRVSQINAIGLLWIEHGLPMRFTIEVKE